MRGWDSVTEKVTNASATQAASPNQDIPTSSWCDLDSTNGALSRGE